MSVSSEMRGYSFSEAIRYYMEREQVSVCELAERCGIPPSLIYKARISGAQMPFLFPAVFGIGLGLSSEEIHFLLTKNGHFIPDSGSDTESVTLCRIIDLPYPKTVAECDEIMVCAGLEKLTDFEIADLKRTR